MLTTGADNVLLLLLTHNTIHPLCTETGFADEAEPPPHAVCYRNNHYLLFSIFHLYIPTVTRFADNE